MAQKARVRPRPSADGILDSAEKLFASRGYADVSLRELMGAAAVSTTAFYARFDSKEAVLAALAGRFFAEVLAEAREALAGVRGIEAGIDRGLATLVSALAPRKKLVRLLLVEAGASKTALTVRRDAYAALGAFLASHLPRHPNADAIAWALIGALELQVVRWAVWGVIELDGLEPALRAAAHAVLPSKVTP